MFGENFVRQKCSFCFEGQPLLNQIRFSMHKEKEFECNSIITRRLPNCTVKDKWHIQSNVFHGWTKAVLYFQLVCLPRVNCFALKNKMKKFLLQPSKIADEQNKKIITTFKISWRTKQKSSYHNLHNWQAVVFVFQFLNYYEFTSLKNNRN